MKIIEKYSWLFMIFAILLGLLLGQVNGLSPKASHLIVPFLMVMLFGIFLQIPFKSLKAGFKNVKVAVLILLINFIWTPFLAFGLSYLFFRNHPDVFVALIMDIVTPCTDWYLVFTAMAGGHLALSTALLPWNLLLQLILMPVFLFVFAGAVVDIQPLVFLQSFIRVLIVPFLIAVTVRNLVVYLKEDTWFSKNILERIGVFQTVFLLLAITAMFASQGVILIENLGLVVRLIIPVILFFAINFSVGQIIGRVFNLSYQEGASLIITILARNAPLALTIAVATFPERPLIPLVLAVESLLEIPILFVISHIMLLIYYKKWWPNLADT